VALTDYHNKRDFERTPEPEGRMARSESGRMFVVQKHAASRLHYDFRLEFEGVLKSWAIPKGPALEPSEKRLAVQVEDHPLEYGSFEGIIPEGEYGGGTVMVWDRGEWEPMGDPAAGFKKGHLKFRLRGQKLRGGWSLIRLHSKEQDDGAKVNWLLIKEKDPEARPMVEYDVTEEEPLSAATGRSMEEIAEAKLRVWSSNHGDVSGAQDGGAREAAARIEAKTAQLPRAAAKPQPERLTPELATLVGDIPEGDEWLHEIKFDGYRIVAVITPEQVRLWTRNGHDWTDKFRSLAESLRLLPVDQAILDGEIVVLDAQGISDFQALQNAIKGGKGRIIYYLFDIPHCQGYDLTRTPLLERRELLRLIHEYVKDSAPELRFSDHLQGKGPEFYRHACRYSLEGVISKRADSPYEQRRSRAWLKIKCSKRQEFVVGGYTSPGGSRFGFGALVLGYYDDAGQLIYAGRVGTGFNEKMLVQMTPDLESRRVPKTPFDKPPTGEEARGVHYVRPELVAQVEFTAWTNEGILRHPSFQGLRLDIDPRTVRRERPEAPPQPPAETASAKEEPAPRPAKSAAVVAGITLSNPERAMYPSHGINKLALALYYEHVAAWILPHIAQRPLMLVRCPHGHEKDCFHQKHANETLPPQVYGIPLPEGGETRTYIAIRDVPGLVALVQLGALEIHAWGSAEKDVERPDRLIFDLDPAPEVSHEMLVETAVILRDLLTEAGLASYCKTSGGKGYHLYAPITSKISWDTIKAFAKAVADTLVARYPKRYIATMSKAKRHGKIFIDYLRTGRGATCVAAYSTRARKGAPVSTPISWEELADGIAPDAFHIGNLAQRLADIPQDPWHDFFAIRQGITVKARRLMGMP